MKAYYLFIAALCFALSSCVTVNYFGDKLTPTNSVDIYYSVHDVTRQYKLIGHLSCTNAGKDYVKEELTAYGKKIGADAIVITGTAPSQDNQAAVVNADALKYN